MALSFVDSFADLQIEVGNEVEVTFFDADQPMTTVAWRITHQEAPGADEAEQLLDLAFAKSMLEDGDADEIVHVVIECCGRAKLISLE